MSEIFFVVHSGFQIFLLARNDSWLLIIPHEYPSYSKGRATLFQIRAATLKGQSIKCFSHSLGSRLHDLSLSSIIRLRIEIVSPGQTHAWISYLLAL